MCVGLEDGETTSVSTVLFFFVSFTVCMCYNCTKVEKSERIFTTANGEGKEIFTCRSRLFFSPYWAHLLCFGQKHWKKL